MGKKVTKQDYDYYKRAIDDGLAAGKKLPEIREFLGICYRVGSGVVHTRNYQEYRDILDKTADIARKKRATIKADLAAKTNQDLTTYKPVHTSPTPQAPQLTADVVAKIVDERIAALKQWIEADQSMRVKTITKNLTNMIQTEFESDEYNAPEEEFATTADGKEKRTWFGTLKS